MALLKEYSVNKNGGAPLVAIPPSANLTTRKTPPTSNPSLQIAVDFEPNVQF